MCSRKYRRILTLTIILSAASSTLTHAQGTPARSVPQRSGVIVQEGSAARTFLEAVQNLWVEIRDSWWSPPPPPPPGGDGPSHREGPGICPHGHM